jgi:glycosyltransferase involved in cell wall biosynthesis
VKCWGSQKNLDSFIKGSFCGLANLKIASGVQGKILSYMSYGLPVICSKKVASNFGKYVISYNNNFELIDKIKKFKNDRKFSGKISEKSLKYIKKFTWQKTKREYLKIIQN